MDGPVAHRVSEKKSSKIRCLILVAIGTPFAMTLLQAVSPSTKLGSLSMQQPIKHYLAVALAAAGTDKMKKVSQDFEGVFLTNMFESMFEGLDDDDPFGAGKGPWRSLLTEEYAKTIAASGGIGIANQIQHQLIRL
jgi:hypothetical protein